MDMNSSTNESSTGRGQTNAFSEGPVAETIEKQTAKLPSDLFLWAGLASIGASLICLVAGKKQVATFIGQWVPTVLLFGVYNKIVKVAGHDRADSNT